MSIPPAVSSPTSPGWSRWIERLRAATAGRFTIIRELGRGGFAAVFLAQQLQPNRRVAIKLLLPAHLDSEWALEHFRGESQKIAEWRHQSVVTIYEVHEVEDLFFFVMSYVEGGSLHDLIGSQGPLSIPIARSVLAQTGSALQYAHRQGVTHRDIKPQNVLIDIDGGAVVTDFGISKQSGGPSHTVTGMIFGSPPYMAPEQCESGATSTQSDQYALGITVYEMLVGTAPFTGPPMSVLMAQIQKPVPLLRTIRPDCPPDLEAAVARMLAKNPADRFPTIADALQAAGAVELPDYAAERRAFAQAARDIASRAQSQVLELLSMPPRIEVGDKIPLQASVKTLAGLPVDNPQIKWSVDNKAVAQLDDSNGELTALAPGFTTVFVRGGGSEQQVRVDVVAPRAASIQVAGPVGPLSLGQQARLTAVVHSKHGLPVSSPTTWISDDPRVATITADGMLKTMRAGRTRIRAQVDEVTSDFWIDVKSADAADVRITGAPSALFVGDSRQLTPVVFDQSDQLLTDRPLQWTSSDRGVATVSPTGMVTACAVGAVTITATCDAKTATVSLQIREAQAAVIELIKPPESMRVGDSVRLRAVVRDAQGNAVDRVLTWMTDDDTIARISVDGTLTAIGAGLTVVSASIDDVAAATAVDIIARQTTAVMDSPALPPRLTMPPLDNAPTGATAVFGAGATKPPVMPSFPVDAVVPTVADDKSDAKAKADAKADAKAAKKKDKKSAPASAIDAPTPVSEPSLVAPTSASGGSSMKFIVAGGVALAAIALVVVMNTRGGSSTDAAPATSSPATAAAPAVAPPSTAPVSEPAAATKPRAPTATAPEQLAKAPMVTPPKADPRAANLARRSADNTPSNAPANPRQKATAAATPQAAPQPTATAPAPVNTPTAPVATAPATAAPVNDAAANETRIRQLVAEYAGALAGRKLDEAVRLFPKMPDATRSGWKTFFGQGTEMRVDYNVGSVSVNGKSGVAKVSGTHKFIPADGKAMCLPVTMQFRVEDVGNNWRIDGLDQKAGDAKSCK